MIQTLILDLGNVLVFHDNALLFQRLADRAGQDPHELARALLGPDWLAANRGELDAEGIRQAVCRHLGVDVPMAEFAPLWSSHFRAYDEMIAFVETLVGRVQLALLSNTNALHAEHLRRTVPLLARFDHLLLSNEVGMVKPDAEIYREVLRRTGTPASGAAFFDDMAEYVEAARTVGIHGHVFTDVDTFRGHLTALGL